jgi:hypothetical protein
VGGAHLTSASLIVPEYSSLPGAAAKLYLDFDGDYTPDWLDQHPGTTPAYSTDADTNNFSDEELDNIHKIWMGVAEKYSPFKINVTTVDPGNINNLETSKVVIGGNGSWAPPGSGGIGIYYSYVVPDFPNVGFVFPAHLVNGNPRYVAEAAAHEAGHSFGLNHQSLVVDGELIDEYNPGDASRAPIMGRSYFATRGTWWNGQQDDFTTQDDLAILSKTGQNSDNFGYRTDDHGSTLASADALTIAPDFSATAKGILEKTTDSDYFNFSTPGGLIHLRADVAEFAPMLDLSLRLYNSAGVEITRSATSSLGESVDFFAPAAGQYTLRVMSAGVYGDIGQYTISGSVIPEPASITGGVALLGAAVFRRGRRRRSSLAK